MRKEKIEGSGSGQPQPWENAAAKEVWPMSRMFENNEATLHTLPVILDAHLYLPLA